MFPHTHTPTLTKFSGFFSTAVTEKRQTWFVCTAPVKALFQLKRSAIIAIFLTSPQNHMLWFSLEAPHQGTSNEYPQHMILWRNMKKTMLCGYRALD